MMAATIIEVISNRVVGVWQRPAARFFNAIYRNPPQKVQGDAGQKKPKF